MVKEEVLKIFELEEYGQIEKRAKTGGEEWVLEYQMWNDKDRNRDLTVGEKEVLETYN